MMMKKIILLLSIISVLFSTALYSDQPVGSSYDFRKANWGMTKLEVMSGEDLKPVSFTGPNLVYKTIILNREMHLIYEFVDNRLVSSLYAFITFSDSDYLEMKDLLIRKYKTPLSVRDDGPIDYEFRWVTQTTEIVLKPGRGRDCWVEYTGVELKKFIKDKDALSDRTITDEVIENF